MAETTTAPVTGDPAVAGLASNNPYSSTASSTPNSSSNGSANIQNHLQNAKDTITSSKCSNKAQRDDILTDVCKAAQSTMNAVQNSQAVQNISNGETALNLSHKRFSYTILGPVAENVKAEANKTSAELQNVANARTTPAKPAVTGQPLTHYHSMFYNLLSWQNPRASAIAFAASVTLIFAARYLSILRYAFKFIYIILGITAALEIAGKLVFANGFASSMRPRKYYTIPRDTLERSLGDIEQLLNFFVIESQRIIFAENVAVTVAAFVAALFSYVLIKFVPLWGLTLIATCVCFLAPLIYVQNKEAIDGLVNQTTDIVNEQTQQLKHMTAEHTERATASIRSYAGEYSSKAQGYLGGKSPASEKDEKHVVKPSAVAGSSDLPSPPKQEPTSVSTDLPSVPMSTGQPPAAIHTSE